MSEISTNTDSDNKTEELEEQKRLSEAEELLKKKTPYREINDILKKKFGKGLSNNSLQKLKFKQASDIVKTQTNPLDLTSTEISIEECFQKKQYEPRRIIIKRKLIQGQSIIESMIDIDIDIHLGNQYLIELEALIKKYSTIKAKLEAGNWKDSAERIIAERQMVSLLSTINDIKDRIKKGGMEDVK